MTGTPIHWRCGRPIDAHSSWCSDGTLNDCTHCGGNPCRWWCLGSMEDVGMHSAVDAWDASAHVRRVLEPV